MNNFGGFQTDVQAFDFGLLDLTFPDYSNCNYVAPNALIDSDFFEVQAGTGSCSADAQPSRPFLEGMQHVHVQQ